MIKRTLKAEITRSLGRFPVVGILGARQTGKTTLAKSIIRGMSGAVYLDLELPSDAAKLQEAELYLSGLTDRLVVIDEVQRMPELFPLLRALVDKRRKPGRFLLLGSASPDLVRRSSESLAGRVEYHELGPFHLGETSRMETGLRKLWLRGGYPDSYQAGSGQASLAWRNAYIRTYLERDIPQLGIGIPAAQLRRFWTMLAHINGQLWNASLLAKGLGISVPTVQRYMHLLEDTFIVRVLQPYHANIKKRLVKAPKVYIRDTGLLHALLTIPTLDTLQGHPAVGHSWEGFMVEQILAIIKGAAGFYFYRTGAGAEIDLVLLPRRGKPVAVEVKFSGAPSVSKGFINGFKDLGCTRGFVVYPGKDEFPLKKNVAALPASRLGKIMSI